MTDRIATKLIWLNEVRQELEMSMWALCGGDYCLVYSGKDIFYAICEVRRVPYSASLLAYKAPQFLSNEDVVESFQTCEFDRFGWEVKREKLPALAFNPRNLFRYSDWKTSELPSRIPSVLTIFFAESLPCVDWTILLDQKGRKHLLMRDPDAEVIVVYPSNFWRL